MPGAVGGRHRTWTPDARLSRVDPRHPFRAVHVTAFFLVLLPDHVESACPRMAGLRVRVPLGANVPRHPPAAAASSLISPPGPNAPQRCGDSRQERSASGECRSIDPPAWLSVVEWPCPRRDRRRHGCRRRGPMDGFTPCPGLGKAIPRRPAREGAFASRARRAPTGFAGRGRVRDGGWRSPGRSRRRSR